MNLKLKNKQMQRGYVVNFIKNLAKVLIFSFICILGLLVISVFASMVFPISEDDLVKINNIEKRLSNDELFKYKKDDKFLKYIKDAKEVNGVSLYEYMRIMYMKVKWESRNKKLEKYLNKKENEELKIMLQRKN